MGRGMSRREALTGAVVMAALLIALGLAGSGDFAEAERIEAEYCEMVRGGHWPAYRPEINCNQ